MLEPTICTAGKDVSEEEALPVAEDQTVTGNPCDGILGYPAE